MPRPYHHPRTTTAKASPRAKASPAAATLAPAALAVLAVLGAWHMLAPMLAYISAALALPMP